MASLVERVKQADERTINLITGYSKHLLTLTSSNKTTHHVVPQLVVYAIIAFYYNPEYFTDHGTNIMLNDARNVATISDTTIFTLNTVYGNIKITKNNNLINLFGNLKLAKHRLI